MDKDHGRVLRLEITDVEECVANASDSPWFFSAPSHSWSEVDLFPTLEK